MTPPSSLRVFARAERLAATAKAMTARRASECRQWAQSGARSPDQWLAQVSGTTERAARTSLAIAKQMDAQSEFAGACQAGDLSPVQAGEIAAAAEVDPNSTRRLIVQAGRSGLRGLRESCRQVVTAGRSTQDDEARRAAIHRGRYLRTWTDGDGAGRLDARLTPEALAQFQACLRPFHTQQFEVARKEGRREHPDCYAVDALVALAITAAANSGASPGCDANPETANPAWKVGPPATVIALIDHAALVRGHVEGDECCLIKGVGPVPVATVRAMLSDAFLSAVVQEGIDIRSVAHIGRRPTAAQRTALWVRDRACVVPGCENGFGLEAHHIRAWSETKTTTLDDLALLCSHHHDLASYQGWTLTGRPGHWGWRPPPGGILPGPFDDDGLHLPHPGRTEGLSAVDVARDREPPDPAPHPLGLFGP